MKFVRVPASGGLRWKNTTNSVGDIICDEPNYILPLSIEVKFVRDINFEHLLYHRGNKARRMPRIRQFWKQAYDDSQRGKKRPFLMMRYNGLPSNMFFVVIGYHDWKALEEIGIQPRPFLQLDQKIFITTTKALGGVHWFEFEEVMLQRIKKTYGKKVS